ncbi:MAG: hypothetical protein IJV27_06130 [Prevotella sp.]|nr:hypothetical protein [Prevotella sp.]
MGLEEEFRLLEKEANGWKPAYDVEHHGVGLADIPFEYAPEEVIYWEGDYDEAANACVRENLPLIRECMAKWGLRFVYLPLLVEELTADADLWRYRQPYGEAHAAEGMVAPPSNFMLDYMERPENRSTVAKPAFAIFNLGYQGYEDDFKVTHFIYELYMLDVDAARRDPVAYFSYLAELCGRPQPSRLGCCKTGPPSFDDADDAFERDTQIMLKEVEAKINLLRHRGVSDTVLQQLLKPEPQLSRLVVTPDYRLLLPDYGGIEVRMEPLVKTVFLFFLYHPEGIRFKCLSDYRKELADLYDRVKGGAVRSSRKNAFGYMTYSQSIMALTDPLNNSINEKCARIREAFLLCFSEDIAQHYFITGARGEPKGIRLPREKVMWECENAPSV